MIADCRCRPRDRAPGPTTGERLRPLAVGLRAIQTAAWRSDRRLVAAGDLEHCGGRQLEPFSRMCFLSAGERAFFAPSRREQRFRCDARPPPTPKARAISRFPALPWAVFRKSRICSLLGSPARLRALCVSPLDLRASAGASCYAGSGLSAVCGFFARRCGFRRFVLARSFAPSGPWPLPRVLSRHPCRRASAFAGFAVWLRFRFRLRFGSGLACFGFLPPPLATRSVISATPHPS